MSNSAEVFSRPNTDAKIHDLEQYTLWTDTPDRPNYRSRMTFGERNGAPRITVFPNLEEGPSVIPIGMHPTVWEIFLDQWEEIIRSPEGGVRKMENLAMDPTVTVDKNTNRDDVAKILKNTLYYGKNAEGVCWIGIENKGMKRIAFKILPSVWHHFYKEDGSQIQPRELSVASTLGMIRSLRNSMYRWTSRIKTPWEPDPTKTKGNFKSNKGNSSMSTPAKSNLDFSDDITF